MNLKIFKATLFKDEVISLESIHKYQYLSYLDSANKSEATSFRIAIDTARCYTEEMLKEQAQKEFDNYLNR